MELSRALTKVLPRQCGENTQGLLYIGKKGREMRGGGEEGTFRRDLLDQKSKSPLFPGPWWLQMISALLFGLGSVCVGGGGGLSDTIGWFDFNAERLTAEDNVRTVNTNPGHTIPEKASQRLLPLLGAHS